MGEKGNFVETQGGDTAFIAGAAGTVVTVAEDLGSSIKGKVVDAAANQILEEGRERLHSTRAADSQEPPEDEAPR